MELGASINVTNETEAECSNPLNDVDWLQPGLLISLIVLGLINVAVLLGNCLVVLAVFLDSRLRTVTNLFIVSLAMADLSVGVAVLPFSASLEVLDVWIYGEVWCSVWLAVDVWMCTASILNLCAISLDRYLAVTRPVAYPSLMSPTRAKILIALVWTLSFVICFPPLVGWNDRKANVTEGFADNRTDNGCIWTCELTNDVGYVVYSALGSFFLPTLVMLFFYWRIYRAAVKTIKAINQGFKTTKESSGRSGQFAEKSERLTLRIHRGRANQRPLTSVLLAKHGPPGFGPALAGLGSREMARLTMAPEESVPGSRRSSNGFSVENNVSSQRRTSTRSRDDPWFRRDTICEVCGSCSRHYHYRKCSVASVSTGSRSSSRSREHGPSASRSCGSSLHVETSFCNGPMKLGVKSKRRKSDASRKKSCKRSGSTGSGQSELHAAIATVDPSAGPEQPPSRPVHKLNRRNIKAHVKRFKTETKAAKTVGVIVGGFIFCWLPFFTMYIIRAFCPECIPPLLFSVLFWLGYCNSAINPCIYALFSKDFRFAFKKILCNCHCTKKSHGLHSQAKPPQLILFSEDSDNANEEHSESN